MYASNKSSQDFEWKFRWHGLQPDTRINERNNVSFSSASSKVYLGNKKQKRRSDAEWPRYSVRFYMAFQIGYLNRLERSNSVHSCSRHKSYGASLLVVFSIGFAWKLSRAHPSHKIQLEIDRTKKLQTNKKEMAKKATRNGAQRHTKGIAIFHMVNHFEWFSFCCCCSAFLVFWSVVCT